mmetsp:Transcript_69568/g.215039  ORF Transcript_69568/g.215039 Transcript_69568/m.215039 type:complete len:300 (+) Transcript_69568:78-977(+)
MASSVLAVLSLLAAAGASRPDSLLSANVTGNPPCQMLDLKWNAAMGGVLQDSEVPRPENCRKLCQDTPGCAKYTWFVHGPTKGNCWLHPQSANSEDYKPGWFHGGAVAGEANNCDDCYKAYKKRSYMGDLGMQGYFGALVSARSFMHCQEQCQTYTKGSRRCEYWTYRENGACYLQPEKTGTTEYDTDEPYMTGPRECPGASFIEEGAGAQLRVRVHSHSQVGADVVINFGTRRSFRFNGESGRTFGQVLQQAYADAKRSGHPLPPGLVLRNMITGENVVESGVVPKGSGTIVLTAVQP